MVAEPRRAARAVERREDLGARQAERVRRPVVRLDEPEPSEQRRHRERVQVRGPDPGQVGVDDEAEAGRALEAGRDRVSLPAARIVHQPGAEVASDQPARRVVGHDPHVADRERHLDDVAEHRERHLATQVFGQAGSCPRPGRESP